MGKIFFVWREKKIVFFKKKFLACPLKVKKGKVLKFKGSLGKFFGLFGFFTSKPGFN